MEHHENHEGHHEGAPVEGGMTPPPAQAPVKKKKSVARAIFVLLIIAIVLGLAWIGYSSFLRNDIPNPDDAAFVEQTLELVSKHMILPSGSEPFVASITDAASLIEEQQFYRNAQDGDTLIIYGDTQQAIIYSPNRDIIVNVGALVAGEGN